MSSEIQEGDGRPADRSRWMVRKGKLGDLSLASDTSTATPQERLAMVWPLTIQVWAFRGVDVAESRLPRHLIRITRRER